MTEISTIIKQNEDRIEQALWSLEIKEKLDQALEVYRSVETDLKGQDISSEHEFYAQQQRVMAYCLIRQGNILRQMGQLEDALELGEREVAAARASADTLTSARSLMSNGTNWIVSGEIEEGMNLVEESRLLFEQGVGDDFKQGLGWYWILQADLGNAGLLGNRPSDVIDAAANALAVLSPLENWTGVARAYAARAQAHQKLGDEDAAAKDRQAQQRYEKMVEPSQIVGKD